MTNKNLKVLKILGDSVKPMYQPYVKRVSFFRFSKPDPEITLRTELNKYFTD